MSTEHEYNTLHANPSFLKALGKRVLSEANDLKRTPEALSDDLGYEFATVQSVINGDAEPDVARALLLHMCEAYPISLADIWLEPDDTQQGVKIMRASVSRSTSRTFSRRNRSGGKSDYYEYRDTAMSSIANFKPEWIKQIRVIQDSLPDNPDVIYNNGHLMHQCTFFIGEVNFYWEIDGVKHCAEMNTGDSNYITPFVPHSFASRNPDELGLIIAVTFGVDVRKALNEFANINADDITLLSDNLSSAAVAYKSRLNRYLNSESLSLAELIERLMQTGMDKDIAEQATNGDSLPSPEHFQTIASALNVRPEDLFISPMNNQEAVIVKFAKQTESRPYPNSNNPACHLTELARTPGLPGLRGFNINVLSTVDESEAGFCHHLHEYIYNYGDAPVQIYWGNDQQDVLHPGDSAYVRPMVQHRFSCRDRADSAQLIVVRIPGALNDSVINEFSRYPQDRRNRVLEETVKWF